MNTELTTTPEAARAANEAEAIYQVALAYTIDGPEMYEAAGAELRTIASKAKEMEELRLSLTRPLDESKRRIMDLFKPPLERMKEAEGVLRKGMLEFKAKRDAEERAAREAAERAAREERERLAREKYAAEEAARKAREQAAALVAAGNAEAAEELELAAEEAEHQAEAAAEAVALAEVAPPPSTAVVPQAKAAGVSSRQTWKAEVVDLAELVLGVAEGLKNGDTTGLAYLQANTTALGGVAKSLKGQARVRGVRFYAEETLAVRRA